MKEYDILEIAQLYIPHFILYWDDHSEENLRFWTCTQCGTQNCSAIDTKGELDPYLEEDDEAVNSHGDCVTCPCCYQSVKMINLAKMKSMKSLEVTTRLVIPEKIDENKVVFTAYKFYNHPTFNEYQTITYDEVARYVLTPGEVTMERYDSVDHQWRKLKKFGEPYLTCYGRGGDYIVYGEDENCTEAFCKSFLKYSQFLDFTLNVTPENNHYYANDIFKMTYLCHYAKNPNIEFLMKARCYQIVKNLVYRDYKSSDILNWQRKDVAGFFRLEKKDVKFFAKSGYDISLLREFREAKKKDKKISFQTVVENFLVFGKAQISSAVALCSKHKITPVALQNYLKSHSKSDLPNAFMLYKDYVDLCEQLQRDLSEHNVLFPKQLSQAHDDAARAVNVLKDQETARQYKRIYKNLRKKFSFADDRFEIVIPKNAEAIRLEGEMQSNCVAGYADRHVRGETVILFLREKDKLDESFFTIEMLGNECRQVYGWGNYDFNGNSRFISKPKTASYFKFMKRPRKQAEKFFNEWLSWVQQGSRRKPNGDPIIEEERKEKVS